MDIDAATVAALTERQTIMATLDLSTLTVKDAPEAPKSNSRGRQAMDNPFMEVIKQSYDTGVAKSVTVPNGTEKNKSGESMNVVTVVGLLRRAAEANGIGVRMETIEKGNRTEIRFLGKVKTERTRKPTDAAPVEGQPESAPDAA
jgi:hypothetical protein